MQESWLQVMRGVVLLAVLGAVRAVDKCRVVQNTMMSCHDATADDLPKTTNEKIEWILFAKSKVPVLRKEHLEKFPGLTDLHAEGNQVEKVERDAFDRNPALDWVDLSFNKLTVLHPDMFRNSPNVYYLNVSGNPGLIVPKSGPFVNAPKLQWLLLAQSNLEELHSDTFKNVPSLKVLSLADNKLSALPVDLFAPLKNLYSLDLSRNRFANLPASVFEPLKHVSVYLGENPWNCDCSLHPTMLWAKNRRVLDQVRCEKPEKKKWQDVDLRCPDVVEVA